MAEKKEKKEKKPGNPFRGRLEALTEDLKMRREIGDDRLSLDTIVKDGRDGAAYKVEVTMIREPKD